MARRTLNRQPLSIAGPNSSDIKDYYFTHSNWKGMCTNKNFIGVDQETFEDCDNVFIGQDGILKSRPPIKQNSTYKYKDIVQTKVFKDYLFVHYCIDSVYYLDILKNEISVLENVVETSDKLYLYFIDNKVFIFSNNSFEYFDLQTEYYGDASNYIYIPKHKVETNGVEDELEDENLLTNTYKKEYLYSYQSQVNFYTLNGKNLIVKIDNVEYEINNFEEGQEKVFVKKHSYVGDVEIICTEVDGTSVQDGTYGELDTIFIEYSETDKDFLNYSVDGKVFKPLPSITGRISKPALSEDGSTIYIIKSDGVYAYSLFKTMKDLGDAGIAEYTKKYPTWEKLPILSNEKYTISDAFANFYADDIFCIVMSAKFDTSTTNKTYLITQRPLRQANDEYQAGPIVRTDINAVGYSKYNKVLFTSNGGLIDSIVITRSNNGIQAILFKWNVDGTVTPSAESVIPSSNITLRNASILYYDAKLYGNKLLIAASINRNTISAKDVLFKANIKDDFTFEDDGTVDMQEDISTHAVSDKFVFSNHNNDVITENYLFIYNTSKKVNYLFNAKPVYFSDIIWLIKDGELYSSLLTTDNIVISETLNLTDEGKISINNILPSFINILTNLHMSIDNKLYVNQNVKNDKGEFLWYFPKKLLQKFNYEITNLHNLSSNELGIFFENEIWYSILTENGYTYTKSKLNLGCKKGADVITSQDGKYVIFATERGLATMSYQDFVASTEQTLTYLTDAIQDKYDAFNKFPIKLYIYKYWIVMYNNYTNLAYLFDTRNSSWWKWHFGSKIINLIFAYNNQIYILCDNKFYFVDENYTTYFDAFGKIKWSLKSQKLHLNAINYYKHISQIILDACGETKIDEPFTFGLKINVYRDLLSEGDEEVLEYEVDSARTFVKRFNFMKAILFQYEIKNDQDNVQQSPLLLTSIVVKYGVKGKIRNG